jgi:hypothetical protein
MNTKENPTRGFKHYELAKAFACDFDAADLISSQKIGEWATERGYPRIHPESKETHVKRMIRCLRTAGDHPRMETNAFRIVNRGWHTWQKELITPDVLREIQEESYRKMMGVAINGKRKDQRSRNVLMDRPLSSEQIQLIKISPQIYQMVIKSLKAIEENWHELVTSVTQIALDQSKQLGER